VASGQVKSGDFVRIDLDAAGKMTFVREAEGALVPILTERPGQSSAARAAAVGKDGKVISNPNGRELATTPLGERN